MLFHKRIFPFHKIKYIPLVHMLDASTIWFLSDIYFIISTLLLYIYFIFLSHSLLYFFLTFPVSSSRLPILPQVVITITLFIAIPFFHSFIYLFTHLFIYLFIHLFLCLLIYLFIYLFICLFVNFYQLHLFFTFHSLPRLIFHFLFCTVGVEADCVEGLYNLGLVNLKLNSEQEAHNAFDKLHTILPRLDICWIIEIIVMHIYLCALLNCIVLNWIELNWIVLYCIALYCTVLYCIAF